MNILDIICKIILILVAIDISECGLSSSLVDNGYKCTTIFSRYKEKFYIN